MKALFLFRRGLKRQILRIFPRIKHDGLKIWVGNELLNYGILRKIDADKKVRPFETLMRHATCCNAAAKFDGVGENDKSHFGVKGGNVGTITSAFGAEALVAALMVLGLECDSLSPACEIGLQIHNSILRGKGIKEQEHRWASSGEAWRCVLFLCGKSFITDAYERRYEKRPSEFGRDQSPG